MKFVLTVAKTQIAELIVEADTQPDAWIKAMQAHEDKKIDALALSLDWLSPEPFNPEITLDSMQEYDPEIHVGLPELEPRPDKDCISLPDGDCVAPSCPLHGPLTEELS